MTEPDNIRQQMARIRHDLHKDVSGLRGEVERALDWKWLPRNYPLTTVFAALAAGYVIVPRRGEAPTKIVAPEPEDETVVASRPRRGLASYSMGLLSPIVEQAIQTYAALWIEGWMRRHLGRGPTPSPAPAETRKGSPSGNDFVFNRPVDLR
jgi:hypothetical protein